MKNPFSVVGKKISQVFHRPASDGSSNRMSREVQAGKPDKRFRSRSSERLSANLGPTDKHIAQKDQFESAVANQLKVMNMDQNLSARQRESPDNQAEHYPRMKRMLTEKFSEYVKTGNVPANPDLAKEIENVIDHIIGYDTLWEYVDMNAAPRYTDQEEGLIAKLEARDSKGVPGADEDYHGFKQSVAEDLADTMVEHIADAINENKSNQS